MKEVVSIPNASRTFDALRNLGYDLNSSVADVVDNAVTEKVSAKNIAVDFVFDSNNSIICRIQDDGCGMSSNELEEAMRIGTKTDYSENDLGKFGMGMKTASLSQCNKLTVISKNRNSEFSGYIWDVDHINKNGWTLLELEYDEICQIIEKEKLIFSEHGTTVLWDDLFWINEEYRSYNNEKFAHNFYYRLVESLKLHLRMVYHRFLDGSLGEHTIKLRINGELLSPWNPFFESESNTEKVGLKSELSELTFPGYQCPVYINAFVLPTKEGFSSEETWKEAKGLLSWNDSQGYYIYRANRIIRFGGWQKTKAKDEHDKLARIGIDIDSSLDKLFRITVNKAKINFPELLFQHLKNKVNPIVVKKAKAKYNNSEENFKVSNGFRRSETSISRVSKGLLQESNITTRNSVISTVNSVEVENPSGTWLSNKINDFLKYGTGKDYEIVSANLNEDELWKIVCSQDDKFKVIVNASHPFYTKVYQSGTNKAATSAVDALIFSLAFAELYNKNNQNAQLFDTYKAVCSKALERLISEGIL